MILFSHPADFTPVCTTEFVAFPRLKDGMATRQFALLGNPIDSVYSPSRGSGTSRRSSVSTSISRLSDWYFSKRSP